MIWVTSEAIEEYSVRDSVRAAMATMPDTIETRTICHAWLADSLSKRFIFNKIYADLLTSDVRYSILDIGGGLTGFTRQLAQQHDYTLVDLLAHDDKSTARAIESKVGRNFVVVEDWLKFLARTPNGRWDVVIANDLLPNVDQRLVPFIETILPRADKVLMSLTYYNEWRWYISRRLDADEMLTQMSWDHHILSSVLERFQDQIVEPDFSHFGKEAVSVFPNGRQVCLVNLKGMF